MSGFLQDERDSRSSARLSWWIVMPYSLLMIALDAMGRVELSAGAWTLLGTIVTFVLVWTAGPRMAQHLAPQIGKAVQAVGDAAAKIKERRDRGKDHGEEPA